MPHLLAQELESRLEANTLSFALLQRLLFQVPLAIMPTSTREAIGKRLVDEPFRAPALVSAGVQLGALDGPAQLEALPAGGGLQATATVMVSESQTAIAAIRYSTQKKTASQEALVRVLCKFLGLEAEDAPPQIGRASCRERVCQYV